ncbi:hypothetical protein PR048_000567 [Dryococelus australis]|uniref:Uncharacterized protein n=1 Tax=Dryococelus australis TaxID=614101 RepID=A0ABQ9IF15_9NEOP|nr:hypothetical protein PR048_000567 [Dryococelus australis]
MAFAKDCWPLAGCVAPSVVIPRIVLRVLCVFGLLLPGGGGACDVSQISPLSIIPELHQVKGSGQQRGGKRVCLVEGRIEVGQLRPRVTGTGSRCQLQPAKPIDVAGDADVADDDVNDAEDDADDTRDDDDVKLIAEAYKSLRCVCMCFGCQDGQPAQEARQHDALGVTPGTRVGTANRSADLAPPRRDPQLRSRAHFRRLTAPPILEQSLPRLRSSDAGEIRATLPRRVTCAIAAKRIARAISFERSSHSDTGDNSTRDQRPDAPTRKALNLHVVIPLTWKSYVFMLRKIYTPILCGVHGGVMVRLFSSHRGKPGSILGEVASGNLDGRFRWSAGFLGYLPLPPPLDSSAAPFTPIFTLVGYQDLAVNRSPNLFTHLNTLFYERKRSKIHCFMFWCIYIRSARFSDSVEPMDKPVQPDTTKRLIFELPGEHRWMNFRIRR